MDRKIPLKGPLFIVLINARRVMMMQVHGYGGVEADGNTIAKRPAFYSAVPACLGDTDQREEEEEENEDASNHENHGEGGSELALSRCVPSSVRRWTSQNGGDTE